jgi:putative heme-binding domain-containing protein
MAQEQSTGDIERGKAIFEGKGQCRNCHRVKGEGGRMGPDLSEIGSLRKAAQLEQSIVDPDAEIAPQNRPFRVVTKAGETVNGKLLNQDTFTVQIFDSREQLRSFSKSDLREFVFVDRSPMPSFKDKLSAQEIADAVAYLGSLKAPERPGQGRGNPAAPRP